MKTKELDVDFIRGQEPLLFTEEKALNDFFKQHYGCHDYSNIQCCNVSKK